MMFWDTRKSQRKFRRLELLQVNTARTVSSSSSFFKHQDCNSASLTAAGLGGVNEVLSVLLMAAKFNIPVCPHAGGVGLCEYVQHISIFDYICVSASLENRILEYVDHLHEHFEHPVVIKNGRYIPPKEPGYSITMKDSSL